MVTDAVLYHLDSSVCVKALRLPMGGVPSPLDQWPTKDIAVSAIVAAELEVGVHKSRMPENQRARLGWFLSKLSVVSFDYEASLHYGDIRADLEKKGAIIGPLDLLIAAHARSLDATLITANIREFKRVKGLKVLAWK